MSPFKKSSAGGKPSGDAKPSDAKVEAPKKEGKGAATEAFGQVRDAIPGSTIETAVGYVPGGGLATSGFKAAKGIGGLGFALGSAGATAVSKKRKKSKAGGDTEAMDTDNEAEIGQGVLVQEEYIRRHSD
ncbi:hypothetical protein H0H92_008991 [Tricholoma furcatifolium]|nr:hypothetical protein H0H92_008991 [Tricholoma furcatifolium]